MRADSAEAAISGDEIFLGDRVEQEKRYASLPRLQNRQRKVGATKVNPKANLLSPAHAGVPTVEDDAVYFLGSFGEVFRINRKTGKADWKIKLSDRYPDAHNTQVGICPNATLIVGDILIVMPFGENTGIAGWDKKTGAELWKSGGIGNTHSSPTVANFGGTEQIILLTTGDAGGLNSFDPKSGRISVEPALQKSKSLSPFPSNSVKTAFSSPADMMVGPRCSR